MAEAIHVLDTAVEEARAHANDLLEKQNRVTALAFAVFDILAEHKGEEFAHAAFHLTDILTDYLGDERELRGLIKCLERIAPPAMATV